MPTFGILELTDDEADVFKKAQKDPLLKNILEQIKSSNSPSQFNQILEQLITINGTQEPKLSKTQALSNFVYRILIEKTAKIAPKDNLEVMRSSLYYLKDEFRKIINESSNENTRNSLLTALNEIEYGYLSESLTVLKKIPSSELGELGKRLQFIHDTLQIIVSNVSLQDLDKEKLRETAPKMAEVTASPNTMRELCVKYDRLSNQLGQYIDPKIIGEVKSKIFKQFQRLINYIETHPDKNVKVASLNALQQILRNDDRQLKIMITLFNAENDNALSDYQQYAKFNVDSIKQPVNQMLIQCLIGSKSPLNTKMGTNPKLTTAEVQRYANVLLYKTTPDEVLVRTSELIAANENNQEIKSTIVTNATQLLTAMIQSDRFKEVFKDDFVKNPHFQALLSTISKFNPLLAQMLKNEVDGAISDPRRDLEYIHFISNHAQKTNMPTLDITSFISDLPKLSASSTEYNDMIQAMAESLFILQAGTFLDIKTSDLIDKAWEKKNKGSNSINQMSLYFTAISNTITKTINSVASLEQRKKLVLFFSNMVTYLLTNNKHRDFATAICIYNTILSSVVNSGLRRREDEQFNKEYTEALSVADKVFDLSNSNKNYHNAVKEAKEAHLPYTPIITNLLKEFIYLYERVEFKQIDPDYRAISEEAWYSAIGSKFNEVNTMKDSYIEYLANSNKQGLRASVPQFISDEVTKLVAGKTQSAEARLESQNSTLTSSSTTSNTATTTSSTKLPLSPPLPTYAPPPPPNTRGVQIGNRGQAGSATENNPAPTTSARKAIIGLRTALPAPTIVNTSPDADPGPNSGTTPDPNSKKKPGN